MQILCCYVLCYVKMVKCNYYSRSPDKNQEHHPSNYSDRNLEILDRQLRIRYIIELNLNVVTLCDGKACPSPPHLRPVASSKTPSTILRSAPLHRSTGRTSIDPGFWRSRHRLRTEKAVSLLKWHMVSSLSQHCSYSQLRGINHAVQQLFEPPRIGTLQSIAR